MKPNTTLAVEAFQKSLRADRSADRRRQELMTAVSNVPRSERTLYYFSTERARYLMGREDAFRERDMEAVYTFDRLLHDIDEKLRQEEARLREDVQSSGSVEA